MKKYSILLVSLAVYMLMSFSAMSQCTPGTNLTNARLLYPIVGTVPVGTQAVPVPAGTRIEANTDYYLDITVNTPMNQQMAIIVMPSADGFGYIPYLGAPYTYIPPAIGVDITPSSSAKTVRFNIRTAPDGADIGQFLYFSLRSECGPGFPRARGSLAQFNVPTNR